MSDFIQIEPQEGSPATQRTEVWLLFDDDHIYVRARLWESHPERMIANEMRRDNSTITQNELFAFSLDTFYDGRNGVLFNINPIGGRMDARSPTRLSSTATGTRSGASCPAGSMADGRSRHLCGLALGQCLLGLWLQQIVDESSCSSRVRSALDQNNRIRDDQCAHCLLVGVDHSDGLPSCRATLASSVSKRSPPRLRASQGGDPGVSVGASPRCPQRIVPSGSRFSFRVTWVDTRTCW